MVKGEQITIYASLTCKIKDDNFKLMKKIKQINVFLKIKKIKKTEDKRYVTFKIKDK